MCRPPSFEEVVPERRKRTLLMAALAATNFDKRTGDCTDAKVFLAVLVENLRRYGLDIKEKV